VLPIFVFCAKELLFTNRRVADGEDAALARAAHTKEALPGPDGLDEGLAARINVNCDAQGLCRYFIAMRFYPGFFILFFIGAHPQPSSLDMSTFIPQFVNLHP
jgi:hypothetical protein